MVLTDSTVDALLERCPVARLATIDARGRPHQVPMVFAREGGRLGSPIDGKPKGGGELARVRHIRERPQVSILLDEYSPDWSRLWWIRLEAVARVVREPIGADLVLVRALERKYPQYAEVPILPDPATLLVFDIGRIRSWSAGPQALSSM